MEVPDNTIGIIVAAWLITQIFTIYAAKWVVKKADKKASTQKDEIVTHFDGELSAMKGDFETSLNKQGREFKASIVSSTPSTDELTADLQALKDAHNESMVNLSDRLEQFPVLVGEQVKAVINGMKGWDIKETNQMMDEVMEESGLDEAMSLGDAYMSGNPQQMRASALARLNSITMSEEETQAHPIKAWLLEIAKAQAMQYLGMLDMERSLGTSGSKSVPSEYRSLGT
jgi:hypothetical protein